MRKKLLFYDWEWRNYFIQLSDSIGEIPNPSSQMIEAAFCEAKLISYPKNRNYPLLHKKGKRKYLFFIENDVLYFKTYDGEKYKDKYGKWWND